VNIEEEVVKDTLENVIDKDIKNYSKTVNKTELYAALLLVQLPQFPSVQSRK
jgi:hypothetical protein